MTARPARARRLAASVTFMALFAAAAAADTVRIATWNISFYDGGHASDIQTSVYSLFSGRCLCPDILVCQELIHELEYWFVCVHS